MQVDRVPRGIRGRWVRDWVVPPDAVTGTRRRCGYDGLRIEAILHDFPFARCEQLQNQPLEISE